MKNAGSRIVIALATALILPGTLCAQAGPTSTAKAKPTPPKVFAADVFRKLAVPTTSQVTTAHPKGDGVSISPRAVSVVEGGNKVDLQKGGGVVVASQNPDFDRGMGFLFANKMPEALDFLGRSLVTDPTNPQAHLNRAEAFYHLNDYSDQIVECDKAIELSKAGWMYQSKHSVKTTNAAEPLVRKDLGTAHAKRGIALWNLGKKEEAVRDFDASTALGITDNSAVYIYRGQHLMNEGKLDAAVLDFNAAMSADKNLALPYCLRGLVYLKQKNEPLAQADIARAGQMDPNSKAQCDGLAERMRAALKK